MSKIKLLIPAIVLQLIAIIIHATLVYYLIYENGYINQIERLNNEYSTLQTEFNNEYNTFFSKSEENKASDYENYKQTRMDLMYKLKQNRKDVLGYDYPFSLLVTNKLNEASKLSQSLTYSIDEKDMEYWNLYILFANEQDKANPDQTVLKKYNKLIEENVNSRNKLFDELTKNDKANGLNRYLAYRWPEGTIVVTIPIVLSLLSSFIFIILYKSKKRSGLINMLGVINVTISIVIVFFTYSIFVDETDTFKEIVKLYGKFYIPFVHY